MESNQGINYKIGDILEDEDGNDWKIIKIDEYSTKYCLAEVDGRDWGWSEKEYLNSYYKLKE